MCHSAIFDHILTEIEIGNFHDAVLQLAGMLDAALLEPTRFAAICDELQDHSLFQFIQMDPLCALASAGVSDTEITKLICQNKPPVLAGHSAKALFAATSHLVFVRAIRERVAHGKRLIEAGWRKGQSLGVIAHSDQPELEQLDGRDISNVQVINPDAIFDHNPKSLSKPFDLIIIPSLADQLDRLGLVAALSHIANWLTDCGTLHFSCFAPGHLGSGWRAACLRRPVQCHVEQDLSDALAPAGLSARFFRDATGSLIWAEVSRADPRNSKREGL